MKKREVHTLWDRDFDVVKSGLAEQQVIAFVQDLLKRYNDLLQERKHWASFRLLAERKLRKAEELAVTILQEARAKAAKETGQLLRGPVAGDAGQFLLERRAEAKAGRGKQNQHPPTPPLQEPWRGDRVVAHAQPTETTSDFSEETPASEEWPDSGQAENPTVEGSLSNPSPCEIDILLQPPEVPAEPVHMASLFEYLEQSQEMSVNGYEWSPSSGWVITVSAQSGRPLTPLLLGIPEIVRVAEEQSGQRSRKRLLVWLKESDVP